jgi:hypothetical protein
MVLLAKVFYLKVTVFNSLEFIDINYPLLFKN